MPIQLQAEAHLFLPNFSVNQLQLKIICPHSIIESAKLYFTIQLTPCIDKVVKIVRGSDDANEAKAALIKSFKLSDEQATYILDMPLRRLTKMSKIELDTEAKELKATISKLTALLKSEEALRNQVSDELSEVSAKYATERRTLIA